MSAVCRSDLTGSCIGVRRRSNRRVANPYFFSGNDGRGIQKTGQSSKWITARSFINKVKAGSSGKSFILTAQFSRSTTASKTMRGFPLAAVVQETGRFRPGKSPQLLAMVSWTRCEPHAPQHNCVPEVVGTRFVQLKQLRALQSSHRTSRNWRGGFPQMLQRSIGSLLITQIVKDLVEDHEAKTCPNKVVVLDLRHAMRHRVARQRQISGNLIEVSKVDCFQV